MNKKQKAQDKAANRIIKQSVYAAMAAGALDPTPGGFDVTVMVLALARGNAAMSDIYEVTFDQDTFVELMKHALVTAGAFYVGLKGWSWFLKMTGIGFMPL